MLVVYYSMRFFSVLYVVVIKIIEMIRCRCWGDIGCVWNNRGIVDMIIVLSGIVIIVVM